MLCEAAMSALQIVFWIVGGYIAIVAGWVGICMFPELTEVGRAYMRRMVTVLALLFGAGVWLAVKVGAA